MLAVAPKFGFTPLCPVPTEKAGVSDLDAQELFDLGAFLDDLPAVEADPKLARAARLRARKAIKSYLERKAFVEIAEICGRSWALGDIWESELSRMEKEMPYSETLF